MARPRAATVTDLLDLLASGEPVPAGRLVASLGVSRPALARLVAEAGDRVLRLGQARATAYVARADSDAGGAWPIWRMRPDTTVEELGTLHLLRGERFQLLPSGDRPNLMRPVDTVPGHFPGLPWFLDDLRPQGFLGRTLAHRQGARLGVPDDLNRWRLRDVLLATTRTGGTGIGDLLPGRYALDLALSELDSPSDAVAAEDRGARYTEWAEAALAGEDVGSSPGGEQPKFTATVMTRGGGRHAALVKFAIADSGRSTRRWADLLACEHVASQCLRAAGLAAATSELIDAEGYTCLEVQRFDRTPDVLGRHGFVSLLALDAAFVGDGARDWGLAAERLASLGWITTETAADVARLYWFGRLIGNSDMHPGNLGFHLVDAGPLALAPAYDMLPMSLAPSRTGAVRPAAPIRPEAPERAGQARPIAWAAEVAAGFWGRVATSERVQDPALREVAARNREVVERFGRAFA